MAQQPPQRALTIDANGKRLREVSCPCQVAISEPMLEVPSQKTFTDTEALWDTGATATAISDALAKRLNIPPIGKVVVHAAHGAKEVNQHMVDILLPNQVGFRNWLVTGADLGASLGILIGMDIITLGDFSITNVNGSTVASFRTPSVGPVIDYVKILEDRDARNRSTGEKSQAQKNREKRNRKSQKKRKRR
jgi:hypothetical protein